MTATVEQTQHEPPRLIRLAVGGQEILITECGQPVANLVGINQPPASTDRAQWLTSLRDLRVRLSTGETGGTTDEILTEHRTVVTTDKRLRNAAQMLGLRVFP